jgi:hypothetical protein
MNDEPALRPATPRVSHSAFAVTHFAKASSSNKLEPLSRRGAGESRRTCWSPLPEGARGSCALKHAVRRTAYHGWQESFPRQEAA